MSAQGRTAFWLSRLNINSFFCLEGLLVGMPKKEVKRKRDVNIAVHVGLEN